MYYLSVKKGIFRKFDCACQLKNLSDFLSEVKMFFLPVNKNYFL